MSRNTPAMTASNERAATRAASRRGAMRRLAALMVVTIVLVAACSAAPSPVPSPSATPGTPTLSPIAPTPTPALAPRPAIWTATGDMADAGLAGWRATLLSDGRVLASGGSAPSQLYDPTTGAWSLTGGSTESPGGLPVLLSDGRVLVYDALYDPHTATWSHTRPMPVDLGPLGSRTLLADGRVLAAGGFGPEGLIAWEAALFDPKTGSWTATGDMTYERGNQSATRLLDGRVLVAGGLGWNPPASYVDVDYVELASAELYDLKTGTSTATGSMATARVGPTATLLADGRVLVVGGEGATGYLASAELYDPATGRWMSAGTMSTVRHLYTATRLLDGRVLVVGGLAPQTPPVRATILASAELYDPATATWSATASMATPRYQHAAALLVDGRVLVLGGLYFGGLYDGPLATAELYDPGSVSGATTVEQP